MEEETTPRELCERVVTPRVVYSDGKWGKGGDVDYMIERCGGHGGSDVSRRRRVVKVVIREAVQSFKTCSLSVQENGKREMGRR